MDDAIPDGCRAEQPVVSGTSQAVYESRINAAMDYVEANLSTRLNLSEMASAASFSPFHFHRIFAAMVGETPADHVRRVRTERAAALLIDQPNRTISTIGASCGFGTPSAFSRAFKETFGLTPGQWRTLGQSAPLDESSGLRTFPTASYIEEEGPDRWRMLGEDLPTATITVEHLGPAELVYLRHTGPSQGSSDLFDELFRRLDQNVGPQEGRIPTRYALYHDDPELTDNDRLRISVAQSAGDRTLFKPPVGLLTLAPGRHAVARFVLGSSDYGRAWQALLGGWLPTSGYEPSSSPYFERFPPEEPRPDGLRTVDICIPVRPLSR